MPSLRYLAMAQHDKIHAQCHSERREESHKLNKYKIKQTLLVKINYFVGILICFGIKLCFMVFLIIYSYYIYLTF